MSKNKKYKNINLTKIYYLFKIVITMDYVSNIGEYVNWLQGYNRNTVGNHPVRQPTLEDYLNSDRTNKLIDTLL